MPEHDKLKDFDQQSDFNLLDIMIVLLKHKWLIIAFIVLTVTFSAARIAIHNRNASNVHVNTGQPSKDILYFSEGLIEPYSESVDNIKALLTSRSLVVRLVEKNNLLPVIFHDSWDDKKQQWIAGSQPTMVDAYGRVVRKLEVKVENNLLKITYIDNNPNLPQIIIEKFILSLSDYLRSQDLAMLPNQIGFIEKKVSMTKDRHLKSRLIDENIALIEKQRRVISDKYYGFNVIDPPFVPELKPITAPAPVAVIKFLSYKSMIPLLMASLSVAIALVFFIEYLKVVRRKTPEKLELLKKYMKLL